MSVRWGWPSFWGFLIWVLHYFFRPLKQPNSNHLITPPPPSSIPLFYLLFGPIELSSIFTICDDETCQVSSKMSQNTCVLFLISNLTPPIIQTGLPFNCNTVCTNQCFSLIHIGFACFFLLNSLMSVRVFTRIVSDNLWCRLLVICSLRWTYNVTFTHCMHSYSWPE